MSKDKSLDCIPHMGCSETDNGAVVDTDAETNIKKACTVADDTELQVEDNGNDSIVIYQGPGGKPNQEIINMVENLDISEAEKPTIEQLEVEASTYLEYIFTCQQKGT